MNVPQPEASAESRTVMFVLEADFPWRAYLTLLLVA
jgi:hypothetical protein